MERNSKDKNVELNGNNSNRDPLLSNHDGPFVPITEVNASVQPTQSQTFANHLEKDIIIEPPSDRLVIQAIMRNTQEELTYMQGLKKENKFFTTRTHVRAFLLLTSVLNGCLVGILTSTTKLFTETISNCESAAAVFVNPFVYIFWGAIVVTMLSNVYNLNVTMRNYSQLYVMPFYESCSIFCNLISGLVLMDEFCLYTRKQLIFIFIGCLISISGILLKLQTLEAFDPKQMIEEDKYIAPDFEEEEESVGDMQSSFTR